MSDAGQTLENRPRGNHHALRCARAPHFLPNAPPAHPTKILSTPHSLRSALSAAKQAFKGRSTWPEPRGGRQRGARRPPSGPCARGRVAGRGPPSAAARRQAARAHGACARARAQLAPSALMRPRAHRVAAAMRAACAARARPCRVRRASAPVPRAPRRPRCAYARGRAERTLARSAHARAERTRSRAVLYESWPLTMLSVT